MRVSRSNPSRPSCQGARGPIGFWKVIGCPQVQLPVVVLHHGWCYVDPFRLTFEHVLLETPPKLLRLPPPLFGLLLTKSLLCLCWSFLLLLSMKDTAGTFHSSWRVSRTLLDKGDLLQRFAPSQLPLCRRLGLAGEDHVEELPLELRPLRTPPVHPDNLVAWSHRALEQLPCGLVHDLQQVSR